MTFELWLSRQVRRADPVGDLARDAGRPGARCCASVLTRGTCDEIAAHLRVRHGACADALDALDVAWSEWCRAERLRRRESTVVPPPVDPSLAVAWAACATRPWGLA